MLICYKFRIYPSKTIEARLKEQLELCRWLYNKMLDEINRARKENRKIDWRGTQALITKVNQGRVKPRTTSKRCSSCDHTVEDLTLEDRWFTCPSCGWEADKDYNASLNIPDVGLRAKAKSSFVSKENCKYNTSKRRKVFDEPDGLEENLG